MCEECGELSGAGVQFVVTFKVALSTEGFEFAHSTQEAFVLVQWLSNWEEFVPLVFVYEGHHSLNIFFASVVQSVAINSHGCIYSSRSLFVK